MGQSSHPRAFYDGDTDKIEQLKGKIVAQGLQLPNVNFDIQPLLFDDAFREPPRTLANPQAASLC
jgi:hypothetical protein